MRKHSFRFVGALIGLAFCVAKSPAAFPTVYLKPVCLKQIHSPTTITYAPDGSGRVFVCDQLGKIYIIQGGMMLPTPFLDIASPGNHVAADKGPGPVITVQNDTQSQINNPPYAERGLLGLAFHPGFANPLSPGYRKFYLNYIKSYVAGVDPTPLTPGSPADAVSVIAEFQVSASDPNVAVPGSERRLLLYTQPQSNHNGGMVEFGPEIGPGGARYLYIGVGDGGSQEDNNLGHTGGNNIAPRPTNGLGNAQDKTRLFGKILRIDPLGSNGPGGQYGIPVDNPFVGVGGGVREEIYSFGMRNPWRFSFDKRAGGTNRLFCGDVGGDRTEEVDIIVSGGNYGWRYKEGVELPTFSSGSSTNPMTLPPDVVGAMIDPIARYAHTNVVGDVENPPLPKLGLSVTGGYVYRGAAIPALQGKFVFGDYGSTSTSTVWNSPLMGLEETSPGSGVFTLTEAIPLFGSANPIPGQRILCLGEDESGEIYIGMKTNAGVLQLDGGLPAGGIYKIVPLQTIANTLPANKDNTIFSEDVDLSRDFSDALGWLYAGRTGANFGPYTRRALIAFNIAGLVPAGAVIQSAQLKMYLNRTGPYSGGTSQSLHRLNQTWGEGTSVNIGTPGGYGAQATTNDATWNYRFFNTSSWNTQGGSFNPTASASAPVAGGIMTWSSAQLMADVQGWLDTPASNAGWMIRGDEDNDNTAVRYDSRNIQTESPPGAAPALALTYSAAPLPTHFETWLSDYSLNIPIGKYVNPAGDLDGDTIPNLVEYAYALSPLDADPPDSGLQVSTTPSGSNTIFTITFPRDPLATDLTYFLETNSDLTNLAGWTIITSSAGGAVPSGSGFVSEIDNDPVKIVTAQEVLPAGSRRFVRLRIVQQ